MTGQLTLEYHSQLLLAQRHHLILIQFSKPYKQAGPNHPIRLDALLPTDQRRYEWLMTLKQGLHVPLVHVSYAPGGNSGNLNWLWHSTANDIDSALQTTQPLIEELKKSILQYHA